MAQMCHAGAKRNLLIALSDGDAFVFAIFVPACEHELQGVQNHSLLQLLAWRLTEQIGRTYVVISDFRYVASYPGVIGQPKPVQPPKQ